MVAAAQIAAGCRGSRGMLDTSDTDALSHDAMPMHDRSSRRMFSY
jgi:hypothetical protein